MPGDTPNSVLTTGQRKFLQKSEEDREEDYSRQGRSHHRRQIRERTRAAFRDFSLLYATLDDEERTKIFDVGPKEDPPRMRAVDQERGVPSREALQQYADQVEERAALREHMKDTLAFLYHSIEGEPGEVLPAGQVFPVGFGGLLEGAIYDAERARRDSGAPIAGIDVTFEVDVYDPKIDYQYAAEKFARGEQNELSNRELRALLTALTSPSDYPADDFAQFGDLHAFADRVEARREELERDDTDGKDSDGAGDDERAQ